MDFFSNNYIVSRETFVLIETKRNVSRETFLF